VKAIQNSQSAIQNSQFKIRNSQFKIRSLWRGHPQAALILLAFVALAVTYSLVTPPFEAGDESRHYAVIKYMADTGQLINQHDPAVQPLQHHWSHEGNQPPLYYALATALTFWIDTGSWDDVFWYNPHTTIGNPLRPDNKNITIHPPGQGWPWRGHVLAVQLIRFMSIAMATVTVLACYAIALRLFKGNRWLAAGAMAITAFNPMFIFISASINNDNAVIMFVTLALWLMVHLAMSHEQLTINSLSSSTTHSPITTRPSSFVLRHSSLVIRHSPVLLGLLIGLGAMSKLYAVGLLPLAAALFLWLALKNYHRPPATPKQGTDETKRRTKDAGRRTAVKNYALRLTPYAPLRPALTWIAAMTALFLLVAGWFYLRNALLYNGDLLALQAMRDTAGQREQIPSLATIRAEFKGFRLAYWALFGGVNILADDWIYTILDGFSLIATLGLLLFLALTASRWFHLSRQTKSKITWPAFILLLGWSLIMISGFIFWNLTQPAGQGRLLYPAIAAISALGMLGLSWWLPAAGQKILAGLVAIGLFLFAAIAPFRYIAPAYASPPILTEADLPAGIQPVNYTYDETMRLVGYQLHAQTVRPAEWLPVTLYWQLLQPTDLNYSVFIHLLGRRRAVIGQLDTYPGGGKWPTTLLAPGDIVAGSYRVPIQPQAERTHAPARLQIAAGIYHYNDPGRPGRPATNAAGQPVEPIIATAKLIPWQWPDPPVAATPINFFNKTTLLSYQLAPDQQSVTLNWQATAPFETDYTVFIQAWDVKTNQYVTGFDGPPVQGDYPTSLWAPGEIIVDTHPLDLTPLPPGTYNLIAGLYNPATGDRLPAFGPHGPLPDYAVTLGQLQIPPDPVGQKN